MQTQVYLDFQSGDGWEDISAYVKYDTLTISTRAFNDSYHYAQNEASFSVIYDATLYAKIIANTNPIKCRITRLSASPCLTTEDGRVLTTEAGAAICVEQSVQTPVFYGTIPPTKSRSFNGIMDNTIISLEATDDLKDLDIEVGDVLYANHTLCNPADPTTSVVHKLCAIAGKTVSAFAPTLDVLFPRWAPENETDKVLTILDDLLYEYGFVLNIDAQGYIYPVRWLYPETATPSYTFDDTNIITSIDIKDSLKNYDGAEVIYYELTEAEKILLYRDDKPPYTDNGSFRGYPVLAGTTYPPETNVDDETTGLPQVVYQEYSDDAITYWTNRAIQENLDYYWKAFDSDFSSILATENHFRSASVDAGLVVDVEEFYNKKCRIVYSNPTAGSLLIYYNNVYGDVWYRSSERTSTINNVVDPVKVYKYSAKFIFEKEYADTLVAGLASQYNNGRNVFTFASEDEVPIGTLCRVTISEGTNAVCIVANIMWDEKTSLRTYTLMGYGLARDALTSQTATLAVQINPTYTFGYQETIGTPEAVIASAPRYTNIVVPDALDSPNVTLYTVGYESPNFVFTSVGTATVNVGSWAFVRHFFGGTDDEVKGLRLWNGSEWTSVGITAYHRATSAQDLMDVCKVYGTPTSGDSYEWFNSLVANEAFIDFLMVRSLQILSGGSLRGGDRYDATGQVINGGASGFFISATGACKVAGIEFEGSGGGGVQWGTPALIGSDTNYGAEFATLGLLNNQEATVAEADYYTKTLRTIQWNGTGFDLVGSAYNLTPDVGEYYRLAVLSQTTVAVVGSALVPGGQEVKLANYDFDGSTWALSSNIFSLPDYSLGGIAPLEADTIAYLDVSNEVLQTYRLTGSDWAAIGTPLSLGSLATNTCAIASLSNSLVIVVRRAVLIALLQVYAWSGSTWSAVGSSYSFVGGYYPAIAPLNGTDFCYYDITFDEIRLYRFDGATISPVGSSAPVKAASNYGGGLCALDGCTLALATFGSAIPEITVWRYGFATSIPYRP